MARPVGLAWQVSLSCDGARTGMTGPDSAQPLATAWEITVSIAASCDILMR